MSPFVKSMAMPLPGDARRKAESRVDAGEDVLTRTGYLNRQKSREGVITISYLGHASFVLQFDCGVSILTDYGQSRAYSLDSPINELGTLVPDIVTFSHAHVDHAAGKLPSRVPYILKDGKSAVVEDIEITAIPTCEKSLGVVDNWSYLFAYNGCRILHLADAQAFIENADDPNAARLIKKTYPDSYDLVLLTIGFMHDIVEKSEAFLALLAPKRAIPMHYWSVDDRERFLSLLEERDGGFGRRYAIERTTGSRYSLDISRRATPTTVISLDAAPFRDSSDFRQ